MRRRVTGAGEELRAAVEEWQAKRSPVPGGVPRLTTGFLDGTHPIVDAYELKARRSGTAQPVHSKQPACRSVEPTLACN